jgi:hypothetical protein
MSDEGFISRWSRRKTASKAGPERPTADAVPAQAGTQLPQPQPAGSEAPPNPLPPVESLTPESDFAPFMKPEVDADTKRKAVKMLFQDPRYNVMDGLDVYIDDYSKPDPLPEGWLEKMTQVARLGEYHDPDREKAQPDKENAEKTARENDCRPAGPSENNEVEQPVVDSKGGAAADTADAGSRPDEMKELPPER